MKIVNAKEATVETIQIGDLIARSQGSEDFYLVLHDERGTFVGGREVAQDFPFKLIDLAMGETYDAYPSLEELRKDYHLVAKSKDLTLHYKS